MSQITDWWSYMNPFWKELKMSKWMSVMALGAALIIVGCKSEEKTTTTSEPKKMSTDACAKCPGEQTANADGSCSACVKK